MRVNFLSHRDTNHQIALEKLKQENALKLEELKLSKNLELEQLKLSKTRELEELKLLSSVWSKTIDTQMHFNEMATKSRQLGLSFVVAALGLALVLLTKTDTNFAIHIPIPNQLDYLMGGVLNFDSWELIGGKSYVTNASVFILLIAAFALYAVSILDTGVYHKMLRGAVAFGEDLEKHTNLKKSVFNMKYGLTESVSRYSRNENVTKNDNGVSDIPKSKTIFGKVIAILCCKPREKRVTALDKIKRFYRYSIGSLITLAIFSFFVFGQVS